MSSTVIGDLRINLGADTAQFTSGMTKARGELSKFHSEFANTNSRNGGQLRMMAQQLSQVAQQGSATGNYLQAMAIQLPDIGLAFGTVGIAAGIAAGALLPLAQSSGLLSSALVGVADALPTIAPYAAGAAAGLVALYAPALVGGLATTAKAVMTLGMEVGTLAATFALANPGLVFVAGLSGALIAANVFRDELKKALGVDIVGSAKDGANYVIGSFSAAFEDIKALWNTFPDIMGAATIAAANLTLSGLSSMLQSGASGINAFIDQLNGALSKIPGGLELGKIGDVGLSQIANPYAERLVGALDKRNAAIKSAMSTDYIGDLGGAIGKGASAAASSLKDLAKSMSAVDEAGGKGGNDKLAESYAKIIERAKERIALNEVERQSIGLSEEASLRMRYSQELLNQTQRAGITITQGQKNELASLAEHLASTEIAARRAQDSFDFAKDATKGFLSDMTSGLMNGKSAWETFGNAVDGILNKIINKIENEFVDALFTSKNAISGNGGGFLSSLSSLFDGLFGGGSGAADPWSGLRVANANGNVFNSPGLGAYSNTVVNTPTIFPFANGAGLMGEAGPEAIMPLKRDGSGRLGVSVNGAVSRGSGEQVSVRIFLDEGLKAEMLDQSAQQTVQIVQSSAGPIARQGAAQAQKDFSSGKWDKVNAARYGAQATVTQR